MEYKASITSDFWGKYQELVRTEMIPYQYRVLSDEEDVKIERERNDRSIPNEKSHAIENFRIAAGITTGSHYGWVFQDSDVYKWLEAVAYSLENHYDASLQKRADAIIDLIGEAQEDDGYLNTYFTLEAPERKFRLLAESHELYCAGHYIEAAIAYYNVTGYERAIDIAYKLADCIDRNFGDDENKIKGTDGHEEIEIALMKLYHLSQNEKYMSLAKFFLFERGKNPDFFEEQRQEYKGKPLLKGLEDFPKTYYQVHKPVSEQKTAEGHAVRLIYLCTALADYAYSANDGAAYGYCVNLWRNIVDKRMYITGGIGSTVIGESFTLDYDLPNDTMYCETCASVGLVFFAYNMLKNEWNGEYGDIMERALYNTAIAGVAVDGRHFFYVNPLEVVPEKSKKDPTKSHVKPVRPEWLGCACCPPNLARLVASLQKYIYVTDEGDVLVNLFIKSDLKLERNGKRAKVTMDTEYPQTGKVYIKISGDDGVIDRLAVRIPAWSDGYIVLIDGKEEKIKADKGIAVIENVYAGMIVEVDIAIGIKKWYANSNVSENMGKVAVSRGPFIYCMEEVDNGKNLHLLYIDRDAVPEYEVYDETFGGIGSISCKGSRLKSDEKVKPLYMISPLREYEECELRFIPYFYWANRGENEMRVWVNER